MPSSDSFQQFLGEEVVDVEGYPVGTFACYWEHEEAKPVLLGVHCKGDVKRTHVVPAKGARLNESQAYVSIPHPGPKIQQAPSLDCDCELDAAFEERVCAYYGLPTTHLTARGIDCARAELRRIFALPGPPNTPPSEPDKPGLATVDQQKNSCGTNDPSSRT